MQAYLFQSTLPRGERPGSPGNITPKTYISIHAPAWGATGLADVAGLISKISIHAPAWGATVIDIKPWASDKDFNPRSRVGSDGNRRFWPIDTGISIHAPAWGATQVDNAEANKALISIHAPAWGATRDRGSTHETVIFQSTLPRGERRCEAFGGSIKEIFQSTLPRGERR